MHFSPLRRGVVLAALIGLMAGCASSPNSTPLAATPPPPPPPAAPATAVVGTPVAPLPAPSAPTTLRALRDTPMPPVHVRMVEPGGLPPMSRVVLVDAPPPPPKNEVIPPRGGGSRQIWLPGHWRYYGHHYVWIGGRWEAPPRAHAKYVVPHWETRGSEHLFFEGYWQLL